jgi:hypothetical protein
MQSGEVLDFLKAIDTELSRHAQGEELLDLYLIGRSALILGYGLNLMTKDIDIIYVHGSELQNKAEELFGKGSAGAERWGFYLETVSSGLPPVPNGYQSRSSDVPGPWKVLRPKQLEIHDLAATKLSRFHVRDREDLKILCDTGRLRADRLLEVLDLAFAVAEKDDPAQKRAAANLQRVLDYLAGNTSAL